MGIMKLLTVAVHSCFLCQRSNFFSSILWVPVFVYPKKSPSSNSEKSVLNHTVRVWRNVDETLTGHVWLAGEELGGRPWRPLASLVIMWRFGPQTELDEVDVFSLSPVVAWDLRTCDGDNEDAENDEDDEHDEDSMKMIIMISWLGLFWWCWIWFLQGSNNISLHPFVCAIEECKALPVQMNRPGSSNIWHMAACSGVLGIFRMTPQCLDLVFAMVCGQIAKQNYDERGQHPVLLAAYCTQCG